MSNEKEPFEQQILFNEDESNSETQENYVEQQVILPDSAWQPVEDVIEQPEDKNTITKRPRWLWRIAGVSLTTLCAYEIFNFFKIGFMSEPIVTSIYAVLFGSVSLMAGLTLFNEVRGLIQLKKQESHQQRAEKLLANEIVFSGQKFCQNINTTLPSDIVIEQEKLWLEQINEQFTEAEVVKLYSTTVLTKVDEQALKHIAKFSTEAVMFVSISPLALLDMLVLLWRNLRMIDKIAGLYGMHLGYWSRIKLLKQVFTNMIYAGASEIVADVGLDVLGVEGLGRISTRAAQGLGAGMLTARLGLKAINMARPIPFVQEQPQISQVRKVVIKEVKNLLLKKVGIKVSSKEVLQPKERVVK